MKQRVQLVLDLRANIKGEIVLKSLEEEFWYQQELEVAIPDGYEIQVRPRSGLALKHGISVLNTPGTYWLDYRGELKSILVNLSKDDYVIQANERIAQMVLNKVEQIEFELVDELEETERGAGGFGHTGK